MKLASLILILSALDLTTTGAHAQEHTGNGGIAYVCRDPQSNAIISARLLDLWEPEGFRPYQDNDKTEVTQLNEALLKLKTGQPRDTSVVDFAVATAKQDLFEVSKPLPLSHDALPDYEKQKGCEFEQVASYGWVNETGKFQLRVYKEIYYSRQFSQSDRAALWLHEGLYQLDVRLFQAQNSRRVRRIVAEVFSPRNPFSSTILKDLADLLETTSALPRLKVGKIHDGSIAMAINGIAGLYRKPVCVFRIEQNGKSVIADQPNGQTESFDGVLLSDLFADFKPGVLTVSIDCTGEVGLQLVVYQGVYTATGERTSVDVTQAVLGYPSKPVSQLDFNSSNGVHYVNTVLVVPE